MDSTVARDFDEARSRDAAPRHGSWPVLAQLPRIAGGAEPPESRRSLPRESAAPTSRSHDDVPARTKRYAVDAGHATIGATRSEPAHAPQGHAEPAGRHDGVGAEQAVGAARSRGIPRLRIDSPAGHRPAAHARTPRDSAEPPTFSAQIFRLHESLAPHRGLVGAAVLVIAGGFLYWLAFARSGMTIHPGELLQFSTDGSHETAAPAVMPEVSPATPADSDDSVQASGWSAPPRVANVEPMASEAPDAARDADATPALGPSLAPAVEAPVPLPPVHDDLPTTTMHDRGVTPTPVAICPTTPYPAYSFGAGAGSVATPAFAVAEQATRYETAMGSPR
jgi:hypothetical protein